MLWNYLLKKFTQILRIVFETSLLQYCSIINNSEPGFHIKLSFGQNVAKEVVTTDRKGVLPQLVSPVQ